MHSEVETFCAALRDKHFIGDNDKARMTESVADLVSLMRRERAEAASLIETLYRERETLREALEPFAEAAGQVPNGHGPDNEPVSDDEPVTMSVVGFLIGDVTAADLAHARSALAEQPQ